MADLSVDLVSRKSSRTGGNRIVLTSKEFSSARIFHSPSGEVLPPLLVWRALGHEFDSDTNAIDVAVKRLRAKMTTIWDKLIQTVRGVG
ncbi:winged helix-turn-helix domain-containing protein [Shigella flexneri]